MTFRSIDPVLFYGVSHVTAALGEKHPELGTEVKVGGTVYEWVYNAANSDINPGYGCVTLAGSTTPYSVTVSAATSADLVYGVVKNATLTTGTYGWVVKKGIVAIEMGATSGTVAAGGLVEIGANGVFVPVSNTTGNNAPACGKAMAEIVSSASGNAYINVY